MREIKFRGKRIDNGEWVCGSLLITKTTTKHYWVSPPRPIFHGAMLGDSLFEVDPKTVGEFASLKDKNGREIYEGDLVRFMTGSAKEIVYHNGGFGYMMSGDFIGIAGHHHFRLLMEESEVVGNIYENLELIKP